MFFPITVTILLLSFHFTTLIVLSQDETEINNHDVFFTSSTMVITEPTMLSSSFKPIVIIRKTNENRKPIGQWPFIKNGNFTPDLDFENSSLTNKSLVRSSRMFALPDSLSSTIDKISDYIHRHKTAKAQIVKRRFKIYSDRVKILAASGLKKISKFLNETGYSRPASLLKLASDDLHSQVMQNSTFIEKDEDLQEFISLMELNQLNGTVKNNLDYEVLNRPKRKSDGDQMSISELLKVVESLNLRNCVLLVICEVMCDAKKFASSGLQLQEKLIRFQTTEESHSPDVRIYADAGRKGSKFGRKPKDCSKCMNQFANCAAKTHDVVRVVSRLSKEC